MIHHDTSWYIMIHDICIHIIRANLPSPRRLAAWRDGGAVLNGQLRRHHLGHCLKRCHVVWPRTCRISRAMQNLLQLLIVAPLIGLSTSKVFSSEVSSVSSIVIHHFGPIHLLLNHTSSAVPETIWDSNSALKPTHRTGPHLTGPPTGLWNFLRQVSAQG